MLVVEVSVGPYRRDRATATRLLIRAAGSYYSADPAALGHLAKGTFGMRPTTTKPDVLREPLGRSSTPCWVPRPMPCAEPDTMSAVAPGQSAQRVPASPIRYPRRLIGSGDPEATARLVLPGVAAGTAQTRGAGTDHSGSHLLSARRVDTADGQNASRPSRSPAC